MAEKVDTSHIKCKYIPRYIVDHPELNSNEKVVYLHFSELMKDMKKILAKQSSISEKLVTRCLKKLEQVGVLPL